VVPWFLEKRSKLRKQLALNGHLLSLLVKHPGRVTEGDSQVEREQFVIGWWQQWVHPIHHFDVVTSAARRMLCALVTEERKFSVEEQQLFSYIITAEECLHLANKYGRVREGRGGSCRIV
jgi:hypothetical protein